MRTHHRMQQIMAAMGTWVAHQRKLLVEKVGNFKADVIMGQGRYRQEHPRGAGVKPFHSASEQKHVGARRFWRRAAYLRKFGGI